MMKYNQVLGLMLLSFSCVAAGCGEDANYAQPQTETSSNTSNADAGGQADIASFEDVGSRADAAVDSEIDTNPAPDTSEPDTTEIPDTGGVVMPDAASADDTGDGMEGHTSTSCGASNQGLMPVDCTAAGDLNAQCVFSNHCFCSEGFVCEEPGGFVDAECAPGSICVFQEPDGARPDSCGSSALGLDPIDCTASGDEAAFCVFGDHCACSEGFVCEGGDGGPCESEFCECEAGRGCVSP